MTLFSLVSHCLVTGRRCDVPRLVKYRQGFLGLSPVPACSYRLLIFFSKVCDALTLDAIFSFEMSGFQRLHIPVVNNIPTPGHRSFVRRRTPPSTVCLPVCEHQPRSAAGCPPDRLNSLAAPAAERSLPGDTSCSERAAVSLVVDGAPAAHSPEVGPPVRLK